MIGNDECPQIPPPRGWAGLVRSAVLHVISLAHFAIVCARGWAANSVNDRVRLAAENGRLKEEIGFLRAETRIKDARIGRVAAQWWPHYLPTDRLAILELRAARG